MKRNLLLLRDLLGPRKTKFPSIYCSVKNQYIDKPDEIVNNCNYTHHRTIRIKSVNFQSGTYIECHVQHNGKDAKFKVGGHVSISKYKNILAKSYTTKGSEKKLVIKKVKNTITSTSISNLDGKGILGTFYEEDLQRTSKPKRIQD